MKARIVEGFKLVIVAENELERIALKEWETRAKISVDDLMRDIKFHFRVDYIDWVYESGKP